MQFKILSFLLLSMVTTLSLADTTFTITFEDKHPENASYDNQITFYLAGGKAIYWNKHCNIEPKGKEILSHGPLEHGTTSFKLNGLKGGDLVCIAITSKFKHQSRENVSTWTRRMGPYLADRNEQDQPINGCKFNATFSYRQLNPGESYTALCETDCWCPQCETQTGSLPPCF